MLENTPLFYVDDDADDLEMFFEVASSMGIETKLFDRGDKLLKTLLNLPPKPCVVFVDLNMSVISGFEVMEEIKANDFLTDIPIIVFSTANDRYTLEKCRKLGADYYITKPTEIKQLKNALRYVLTINWKEHDSSVNFYHKFT